MRDANAILVNEGPEKLREWVDQAPVVEWEDTEAEPEAGADGEDSSELLLDTICARKFARLKLPPRAMLLEPILPERGLAMLFAGRGIGKTHVALGIAYAVVAGGEFLRWRADEPRNVLYVDGEMPQQALQERLLAIMANRGRRPGPARFACFAWTASRLACRSTWQTQSTRSTSTRISTKWSFWFWTTSPPW